MGGESLSEEMNVFLRSRKILQVESQLISDHAGACWCFCIRYLDQQAASSGKKKDRIDYKEVLDAASFQRFSKMREIRKGIANAEALPAFAVFTDEELAGMAKLENLTAATLKKVKGIGEKKVEKYGHFFLDHSPGNEAGQ